MGHLNTRFQKAAPEPEVQAATIRKRLFRKRNSMQGENKTKENKGITQGLAVPTGDWGLKGPRGTREENVPECGWALEGHWLRAPQVTA